MRDRSEILHDALLATEKPVTRRQSNDKLRLLEVEVLVDIRDALVTDCKDALNALIEIRKTP